MGSHKSSSSFNLEDLKNVAEQFKNVQEQVKKESEEGKSNGEEVPKQSLGQKIIGILLLLVIVVIVAIVFISNLDLLFMPKNSVTFIISDQNGEVINGLRLEAIGDDKTIYIEFDEETGTDITELGFIPGEYKLKFRDVPSGYTCPDISEKFNMNDGDKLKLEYECTKDN